MPNKPLKKLSRRHVVKAIATGAGSSLVPAIMVGPAWASISEDFSDGLSRKSPDDSGVDARRVLNFIDSTFANDLDLHSFMLYHKGNVVAEGWSWPYASYLPHMMHSLTKSVTASGVGIAIDEGYFSLNDQVVSFFANELPRVIDTKLESMTVKDLLTMQSGHNVSVSGSVFRQIKTSWIEEFFKIPVAYEPGTHFLYSSALSFMLSAIITRTTKQKLRDYLEPRVFEPLGISGLTWGSSPNAINSGGNGLTWKTSDALKLGILHLNRGTWNGKQLIPKTWVDEATRTQVVGSQYGYHWWQEDSVNAYYAEGAFGQFSIVFPKQDAVLALTAGVQDGEGLLKLVWEQFPAAFASTGTNLFDRSLVELHNRISNLRLLPLARRTTSDLVPKISENIYSIEPNDENVSQVQLIFSDDDVHFYLSDHRGEHVVRNGIGKWIESQTSITGKKLHHQYQADDMRVVAHGVWWDRHTFEMTWQFIETAWVDRVVCRFYGDRISIDRRTNANYASRIQPVLRGQMKLTQV